MRIPPPDVDRAAASRAAIAARRARARIKRDVAARTRSALSVLEAAQAEPESAEARLRVSELLMSVPALGAKKTRLALGDLDISSGRRLGGLGHLQWGRLYRFLDERERTNRSKNPVGLVVLAGPTAVGKGTVATYIVEHHPEIVLSISATTRPPRAGEVDGESYFFVDDAQFDSMIRDGEFLEWAVVHTRYRYGTPRSAVMDALAAGKKVLLEIDVQGARAVRRSMPDARLVFLEPPSWTELVRRLTHRATESPEEQRCRLETARVELDTVGEFDFVVTNDEVARAAQEVVSLMETRVVDAPVGVSVER